MRIQQEAINWEVNLGLNTETSRSYIPLRTTAVIDISEQDGIIHCRIYAFGILIIQYQCATFNEARGLATDWLRYQTTSNHGAVTEN